MCHAMYEQNQPAGIETPESPETGYIGGVLVVDKPAGITSAKAAASVRKLLKLRKIGHTGTLDPFATGVLVLCLNEATRAADQVLDLDKIYLSTFRFGVETDTLDKTGKVVQVSDSSFSETDLLETIDSFRGTCIQKAPRFSAVKVQGRRLYDLSRKGIEVDLPEREVCIHSIALNSFEWPEAVFEISCSKGTYIRQLASDMGRKLGCGAHVQELRRIGIGPFHVDQALRLEDLQSGQIEDARVISRIIPISEALSHLPSVLIEEERILERLKNGQLDFEWEKKEASRFNRYAGAVRIVTGSNRLAALWWPNAATAGSRRLRVFPF
jgi:tRNA pseudouridine55 synthase